MTQCNLESCASTYYIPYLFEIIPNFTRNFSRDILPNIVQIDQYDQNDHYDQIEQYDQHDQHGRYD